MVAVVVVEDRSNYAHICNRKLALTFYCNFDTKEEKESFKDIMHVFQLKMHIIYYQNLETAIQLAVCWLHINHFDMFPIPTKR